MTSRGRAANTKPYSRHARELSEDLNPWDRQPEETNDAYQAFVAYRDQQKRRVTDHGPSALTWSSQWSWGYRCYQWDLHLARADLDDQVRYRVEMNERHRAMARAAQGKVLAWLAAVDGAKLSAADATRLLDLATRLERQANSGDLPVPDAPLDEAPVEPSGGTLVERIRAADLDVELQHLARTLHQRLR